MVAERIPSDADSRIEIEGVRIPRKHVMNRVNVDEDSGSIRLKQGTPTQTGFVSKSYRKPILIVRFFLIFQSSWM